MVPVTKRGLPAVVAERLDEHLEQTGLVQDRDLVGEVVDNFTRNEHNQLRSSAVSR